MKPCPKCGDTRRRKRWWPALKDRELGSVEDVKRLTRAEHLEVTCAGCGHRTAEPCLDQLNKQDGVTA